MRVLMYCTQFSPVIGGAERQAEKLGKTLVSRGLQVQIWTPRLDPDSPTNEIRDGLLVRRFAFTDLSTGILHFPGIGLINVPWAAFQLAVHLWREIGRADIVHCHIGNLHSICVAGLARLRGVPVICKAAIADDRSDLGEAGSNSRIMQMVAWFGRFAFTRWVATTEAVKDALLRAGVNPGRIVIIPNGVDLPRGRPPIRQRPVRRFLYLGRLSTNIRRDVPQLLQAFDALADEMSDVELAVVGGGDLLDETRGVANRCRHASRIRVTGPGDSNEWLEWADCFILPSWREGMSNALLEAMAAGLPCIANDIPPNREVLADGAAGILSPVGDVATMHAEMLRVARDGEYARSFASAGYARVQEYYSLTFVAQEYERLYRALAD